MPSSGEDLRQATRALFGRQNAAGGLEAPAPPDPSSAPVIPGQEAMPAPSPQFTDTQRQVNRLFNAGTVREYN